MDILAAMRCSQKSITLHSKKVILTISIALTIIASTPSFASLVICIYHNNHIYIGTDSLMHVTGGKDFNTSKVFQLANTCWVSITGNGGFKYRDAKTEQQISGINLSLALGKICAEVNQSDLPLQYKMDTVVRLINFEYEKIFSTCKDPTRICFMGYDQSTESFFLKTCVLQGINQPVLESKFERNRNNNETYVSLQGEVNFLNEILTSSDESELSPADFKNKMSQLWKSDSVISDDDLTTLILEMFNLHKINAIPAGLNDGFIGEPYSIYKITRQETSKIR